jgi:hypothetical protein
MKIRERKRRSYTEDAIVEILCDKCGKKIQAGRYDAFEFKFVHKTGSSYPEGGSGEQQDMDLCPECAVECVALLRANGYRVSDTEWDW